MAQDIKGYYSVLGVEPTASQAEIRTAYRELVVKYHPDKNKSSDDSRIKLINEAYSVLKYSETRAAYDHTNLKSKTESDQNNTRSIEPLRCHACNKITAQPRYLVFWRVYSFLIATSRSPVQGIYCSSCAKAEAMKSTIITSSAGWWGVPWGPIWTIGKGFTNAMGGEHDRDRTDALIWYNVIAFVQAKQVSIAYALSERLIAANDKEIRDAANDLIAACRSNGFKPTGELKDPWREVKGQAFLRFAALLTVPVLAAFFIISTSVSDISSQSYAFAQYPTANDSRANNELLPSDVPADSLNSTPVPKLAECDHALSNGHVIFGKKNLEKEGHTLEIRNGSTGDAIIKIRESTTNSLYASFFVEQNKTATLDGLRDGYYKIQYSIGSSVAENCSKFNNPENMSAFPTTESLIKELVDDYRGKGAIFQRLTYTLYQVPNGNVNPETISEAEFESN